MNVRHLLALCLLVVAGTATAAVDIAGVRIEDESTVANQKLVLNGAGIRTRFVIKVYVAALYLPQKKDSYAAIAPLPGARRVSVHMLREVSSDELGQALLAGIRKNSTPEETRRFGLQLLAMGDLFGRIPKLQKGQVFTVDWVPNTGTVISVDGKPAADPIPDEAFYNAILRIWLGDDPADSGLKPAMLGTKAP